MFTSGLSRQPNAAVTSPDSFAFGNPTITSFTNPERMYSFELARSSYQPRPDVDLALNVFYNSLQDIFGVDPNVVGPNASVHTDFWRPDPIYVGFEVIAA